MYYLPEIQVCGFFDSSVYFAAIKKTKQRIVTSFELEFFLENSGISVLNDVRYPNRKESLLFAKPGDIRYTYNPFKTYYIHFNVNDPGLRSALMQFPAFLNPTESKQIKKTVLKIIHSFHSSNVLENYAASAELVTLLTAISKIEGNHSEDSSILHIAQKFIEQNYSEKLSNEDIAKHCNISETHLYRIFKNSYSCTPNDYLLDVRLSAARQLICSTNLTINEIAQSCGFNSQSYFSDCFKRKNAITPTALRKRNQYPF